MKNITLEELGNLLGVSKQYVWDIENGRRPLSYKTAYMISKILDSTPDKVFLDDYKRKR